MTYYTFIVTVSKSHCGDNNSDCTNWARARDNNCGKRDMN